jgi:hypothetical protein
MVGQPDGLQYAEPHYASCGFVLYIFLLLFRYATARYCVRILVFSPADRTHKYLPQTTISTHADSSCYYQNITHDVVQHLKYRMKP